MDFMGKSTKFNYFDWTIFNSYVEMGQNLVPLVNPKIAGKWMFIPLKMVLYNRYWSIPMLEMNFIPHLDRKTGVSGVPEAFSEAGSGKGFSEGVDLAESMGGAPDFLEVPT